MVFWKHLFVCLCVCVFLFWFFYFCFSFFYTFFLSNIISEKNFEKDFHFCSFFVWLRSKNVLNIESYCSIKIVFMHYSIESDIFLILFTLVTNNSILFFCHGESHCFPSEANFTSLKNYLNSSITHLITIIACIWNENHAKVLNIGLWIHWDFVDLQCVIKFWNKIDSQVKNKKANDVALNWYQIKIEKKFQFQIHFIYVIIFCLWFSERHFLFVFCVCVYLCTFLYGDTIFGIYIKLLQIDHVNSCKKSILDNFFKKIYKNK